MLPAWKNGIFCEIADLNVNILDFGLIHCDATYDVMSVQNGYAIGLDYHIDRFFNSCRIWRLTSPYPKEVLINTAIACARAINQDSFVWFAITRGIPVTGSPRDLMMCKPNVFVYAKPYYGISPKEEITLLLTTKTCRTSSSSINQEGKNFSWIDLTTAQWEAIEQGFDSVVLSNNGFVTEGPGFNVGAIINDTVVTPASNCLPGITIQILEKACMVNNIAFEKRDITTSEFFAADEIFVASTAGGITPVKQVDYAAKQTTTTTRLSELFNKYKFNANISRKIY